jgi:DNA invertase Pin-like site-specific DNA recombinase
MAERRMPAISYSRYSDPKQGAGDSEERQARDFAAFCERHKLTPCPAVYIDRGRSGYREKSRKKGRIDALVADAKAGRFEAGAVIVVEAWDRLGRKRPDVQTERIAELLRTGVHIGICRLNDIFTEDDFGTHKWTTLAVFIQLAYQESKQKGERVRAARAKERENVRAGKASFKNHLPAWVERRGGKPVLIPERAAVVRRIFELAAAGCGTATITKKFNREGVPALGKSGAWTRTYIDFILRDGRAVGRVQPRRLDEKTGRFVPDGEPCEGCLPAAVETELFEAAAAGRADRAKHPGRVGGEFVNVFGGLLHAAGGVGKLVCFTRRDKRRPGPPRRVLMNTAVTTGRAVCRVFSYDAFESAVLSRLREIDPASILPKSDAPDEAASLSALVGKLKQSIGVIMRDMDKNGESPLLLARVREKEIALADATARLAEARQKIAHPLSASWAEGHTLIDALASAPDPREARLRLRAALRAVVEEITVLVVAKGRDRLAAAQVFFAGGGRRDYLIHSGPDGWSAKSNPCAAELDLRKPDHARRLAAALAEIDRAAVE